MVFGLVLNSFDWPRYVDAVELVAETIVSKIATSVYPSDSHTALGSAEHAGAANATSARCWAATAKPTESKSSIHRLA